MKTMNGSTILLLIGGHFANAPRPQKEAGALARKGARVIVGGVWTQQNLAEEDQQLAAKLGVEFRPIVDLRAGATGRWFKRLQGRLNRELYTRTGWVHPNLFGPATKGYLALLRMLDPDLTICHCEGALWAGKIWSENGRRVAVDFEDWFSQDLPVADRIHRPVQKLQQLERWHLQNSSYTSTTTTVLADALQQDARANRSPLVIPNVFPWTERQAAIDGQRDKRGSECSFYWYSQTIGPGRGLESLLQALVKVEGEWRLRLRGNLRHSSWWDKVLPPQIKSRVDILDPVPNHDLLARHMSHDVGLALEHPHCPSRDLTATNKIFDYMRAGLAVIATGTRGQQEIMSDLSAGWLTSDSDPGALRGALQKAINQPAQRLQHQKNALKLAQNQWAWERFEPRLYTAVNSALSK